MKPSFLILALALAVASHAQQSYVKYTYDASGNRTKREIIIPTQARYVNPNKTDSVGVAIDSSSLAISLLSKQQLQPVKEVLSGGQTVSIFPNPTKGMLAVEITNTGTSSASVAASLQIFDLAGKQYFSKSYLTGKEEINIENAPAGIYFLRIDIRGKIEEWKIIKQ